MYLVPIAPAVNEMKTTYLIFIFLATILSQHSLSYPSIHM